MAGLSLQDQLLTRPGASYGGVPKPSYGKAVVAGIAAGLVFVVLQVGLGMLVYGESMWAPFRMIAAIAMGTSALEPRNAFDLAIVLCATAIHLGLAALYAMLLSRFAVAIKPRSAPLLGLATGLFLYAINFHGFTYFFPWFAEMRGAVTLLTHLVFGVILATLLAHGAKRRAIDLS